MRGSHSPRRNHHHAPQLLDPIAAWGVLSALTLSGVVRGRPGPSRGTRMRSMTGSNCVQSARWPAVSNSESTRQRPSALRWILVVKPPRERPSASPPAPPPPSGRTVSPTVFRSGVPSRPPLLMRRAAELSARRPHAGGHGSTWNQPRRPSRSHRRHRPGPAPAGAAVPRSRRPTSAGGARRRSSTAHSVQAGHATAPRSVPGAGCR